MRREANRLARLDDALRPPRTDDFHTTVQFLGDTAEEDVAKIGGALAEAARLVEPVAVSYGGLGAFPTPARARVVWAAVREVDAEGALAELAGLVGESLAGLGYPPERRAFHPHVTIGRVRKRPGPDLAAAVEEGATLDLGAEVLSELKLILSDPGDRGYSYIDLTTVALGSVG